MYYWFGDFLTILINNNTLFSVGYTGRRLETEPHQLLPGRMASHGEYTRYRWGHVYDIALQEKHGLSTPNEL